MPDDLKIILTIVGGAVAILLLWFFLATRPFNYEDDIYGGLLDDDPENPEDEARRRQI